MIWIQLIIVLALIQLATFVVIVGKARDRFGVKAPAIYGNPDFERYYRVQMNTIELLILFIPSIFLASIYWSPYLMAVLGLVYLIGRILYFFAYTQNKNRVVAFLMSFLPIVVFLIAGLFGTIIALINI